LGIERVEEGAGARALLPIPGDENCAIGHGIDGAHPAREPTARAEWHPPPVLERTYAPPRDLLRLETNDVRLLEIADALWERADRDRGERPGAPIRMTLSTSCGPEPEGLVERALSWRLGGA